MRHRRRPWREPPANPGPAARVRTDRGAGGRPSTSSSPLRSPSSSPPSTPASACMRVDLPAPDAPSSSTRSPGSIARSSPERPHALRPACRQPQPRASTAAAVERVRRAPTPSRPEANRESTPVLASPRAISHDPRPAMQRTRDHGRDRVHDLEATVDGDVVQHEVVDRHRSTRPGAREHRDPDPPGGVGEQEEHEFGAETLHETGLDGGESAPLSPEQRGDGGRHEFGEQGGARLSDDQPAEHRGKQPDAVEERLRAWQQESERRGDAVVEVVPGEEDERGGDSQHAGHDDVDDPPAPGDAAKAGASRRRGCRGGHNGVPFPETNRHGLWMRRVPHR